MSQEQNSLFGIEDTAEVSSSEYSALDSFFQDSEVISSSDEVEKIETPPKEKTSIKEEVTSEESPTPDIENIKEDPKSIDLLNSFLSEEDEEEEIKSDAVKESESVRKETEQTEQTEEVKETEDDEPPIFKSLSKDLFKMGAFTKDEDEEDVDINTPEEFLERFNLEKKRGANQILGDFISQFGEDYQQAFNAIFVKGVNPKEYLSSYNEITDYSELDLSKEENQVRVVERMLKDNGFEKEDIDSEVEKLRNYGDLSATSERYHKAIVKKDVEKLKQLEQDTEQRNAIKIQQKQQYTQNIQKVLDEKMKAREYDGIPLSPSMARELNDFLVIDKYKTASGELLTDFDMAILNLKKPENHGMKLKLGLLLKTLEKDPTLSSIKKTGVTKQTNSLFEEVSRQKKKPNLIKQDVTHPSNEWI